MKTELHRLRKVNEKVKSECVSRESVPNRKLPQESRLWGKAPLNGYKISTKKNANCTLYGLNVMTFVECYKAVQFSRNRHRI